MSETKGREVTVLRMHASAHIQDYGNIGPVVDKNTLKIGKPLKMVIADGGVLVSTGGNEALIPFGNIVSAQLAPVK